MEIEEHDEFRDHLATVDSAGKRIWLYPKKPKGRFYNARTWVSLAFLLLFLGTPFIKVNGEPLMLFNVVERKFIIFGMLFTPQDFFLFGLLTVTFLVFIILFTVVYGRLFCGWVCPQTVFLEMFFRRIEYAIEGDYTAQKKLDAGAWTPEKIRKKTLKHLVFFIISVIAAHFFLAYLIGMDEVLRIVQEPVSQHFGGFVALIIFSVAFYLVFARLREQVCTTICPYGRLQGVLLVKDSIVVAYDFLRGEPRGKIKKQPTAAQIPVFEIPVLPKKGDCIDCKLCVAVCPTGIDIRNGTQLECTNCTACIDACDEVMDKIEKPRGLIRYTSQNAIVQGRQKILTPRVWAYSGLLMALIVFDAILLSNRTSVETIILRSPGQLFQKIDDSHFSNLYSYEVINKQNWAVPIRLELASPVGEITFIGSAPDTLQKAAIAKGAFFVKLENAQIKGRKTPIVIRVFADGKAVETVKTNFMGEKK